jgi:hypothetical protein
MAMNRMFGFRGSDDFGEVVQNKAVAAIRAQSRGRMRGSICPATNNRATDLC